MLEMFANKNGFSLIEVMMSIAISGIITMIALDQVSTINRIKKNIDISTQAHSESKLLNNYMLRDMRQVGGGDIRPQMALWVEDNCAARDGLPNCVGSDRITMSLLDRNFNLCSVTSVNSGASQLFFDSTTDRCCSAALEGRQLILSEGVTFGHFYISNTLYNSTASICRVTIEPGQAYGLNVIQPPANFAAWAGANMVIVNTSTVYIDSNNFQLLRFIDSNNNRSVQNNEVFVLSDQVRDLQIVLGYDLLPYDGKVTNLNSDQDEWLFNSLGAEENFNQGGLSGANFSDLRMIGISIMSISSSGFGHSSAQAYNGPERTATNSFLGLTQSRAYLRSSYVFSN